MLKERAAHYYYDEAYFCAESLLRAANDCYALGLRDEELRLMAGFSSGFECGMICGTASAACGILSLRYVRTKASESPDIKPVMQLFMRKFESHFGSCNCRDIKPNPFDPVLRCGHTLEAACDILEETITEYERGKEVIRESC